ncbi:MAG: peptidase [Ramlibacter sp.]
MPSFQLFKPDTTITSAEGVAVTLTAEQLKGIAQRYDPAVHEAPIIIGHPTHDAPAFGWVKGLSFADGALVADEQQVDPTFAQMRSEGKFKKWSARFFTPNAKNNPTPGELYLKDVGFLGAATPAVKGLRAYSFADDTDEVLTAEISFADMPAYSGGYMARLFRGLRDWLIDKEGKEVADRVLPDWEVQHLSDISVRAEAQDKPALSFRDPNPASKEKPAMKTPEQLQAELVQANKDRDAALAKAKTLESAETARQAEARRAEHVSFADKLVAEARWPAGAKDVLVATLEMAATPTDKGVLSFGDGDAARPLHEALREQLQALPVQVTFQEVARKGSQGGAGDGLVSFSDQPGYAGVQVDADRLDLDRRIKQHMQAHSVDYATAAAAVSK